MEPKDVTPVELRDGMFYKREDALSRPSGANGSKLRACFHLAERAKEQGYDTVVSAQSVLSPKWLASVWILTGLEVER